MRDTPPESSRMAGLHASVALAIRWEDITMPFRVFSRALAVVMAVLAFTAIAAPARADDLTVEGTEFVLRRQDGRVPRSRDLVGARLLIALGGAAPTGTAQDGTAQDGTGRMIELLIESAAPDPRAAGGAVWLHGLKARPVDSAGRSDAAFTDICDPDPDGRRLGFPLAYRDGRWSLTCTGGAEGKCVRFGYHPWRAAEDGFDPAAYHAACIHMLRADYCGDDRPTTRDGTKVNIWDRRGIQTRETGAGAEGLTFEAAFGPRGAVCLRHVRVPQNATLEGVARGCPRLAAIPTGAACTEAAARAMPDALIFVDSDPAGPVSARDQPEARR